jgi:hypothetical protein
MGKTDFLPDEFKTWMPRYLRYLSALQVGKTQIPGVMGEVFRNVGDAGQPAFATPWRHYQAGASAYGKVRFYKDYQGIVHLEGVAETTATPGAGLIFNLPPGYRPSQQLIVGVQGSPGLARLEFLATGDIVLTGFGSYTSGNWVSLANIHFRGS